MSVNHEFAGGRVETLFHGQRICGKLGMNNDRQIMVWHYENLLKF